MENDEGGLRYSDCAYYCSFSSDEDDSIEGEPRDDLFVGVFEDNEEDTPIPDCRADGSTGHGHTTISEMDCTQNHDDKSNDDARTNESSGYVRFNGKNIKKLCLKDLKGVEFATVDEAEKLYTYYSHAVGFSTRRFKLDKDKEGLIIRRVWVCSKQGQSPGQIAKKVGKNSKNSKCTENEAKQGERKKQKKFSVQRGTRYTRVCCPAAFTICYSRERSAYYVSQFVTHHNHELARPEEIQFLRSHRAVKDHDIAQVEALRSAQVPTSRAYEYLVHQSGGYKYVGFSMKDLYNKLDSRRRAQKLDCDAQSVVTWMNMKGCGEKDFYCKFSSDVEGRLANMFWRDAQSLRDYNSFGDVLILDSTYKTNLYGKPLVVFVGANNHRATVVFGFALIADEKEETYTWVFENFLASMNQKRPLAVLTDGDEAVRNVTCNLMPGVRHRLCSWHIGRNICQNVKGSEAQKSLAKLIYASLTIPQWEEAWNFVVARNSLQNNKWVTSLFNKRDRWAEAYFRGSFFGGMCSTQRCEGMHSKLKKEIGRYTRLCEVMPRLEKTIGRIRNRVLEDNFRSKHCVRVFDTHMRGMEEQAYKIFTDDIFVMIKSQINFERRFVISQRVPFAVNDSVVFYVCQYDQPTRRWCVEYRGSSSNPQYYCSCKQFESDGIPCPHIFCVLKGEMVTEYPKCLIRDRWTKDAGKSSILTHKAPNYNDNPARVARYAALIAECSKTCFNSSFCDEGFNSAMIEFTRLAESSKKYKEAYQKKQHDPNEVASNNNVLRDPVVAKTKGMHFNITTNIDPSRTESRVCGNCGIPGHNRRTCKNPKECGKDGVPHSLSQQSIQGDGAAINTMGQVVPNTLPSQEQHASPALSDSRGHPTYSFFPYLWKCPSILNSSIDLNCVGGNDIFMHPFDVEPGQQHTSAVEGGPSAQFPHVSSDHMNAHTAYVQFQSFPQQFSVSQGTPSHPRQWTTSEVEQGRGCLSQPPPM